MQYWRQLDWVARLLFLNTLIVIMGYAIAVVTAQASIGMVKIIKQVLLFGALFYVIAQRDWRSSMRVSHASILLLFLSFSLFFLALFTPNRIFALGKVQTLVIPLLYVFFSANILLLRYGQYELLRFFSYLVVVTYSIPLISYLLSGHGFSGATIYGKSGADGLTFVSNHFGWSSVMFLLAALFFYKHFSLNWVGKLMVTLLSVVAVYLLFVAANRASLLAAAIALVIILVRYKGLSPILKLSILLFSVLAIIFFSQGENSVLAFVIDRTERQQVGEGAHEGRLEITNFIVQEFNNNPMYWVVGAGIFDYTILSGVKAGGYHNSYWELLFGLGIPLFLCFMWFMLIIPWYTFITRISKVDLIFIPLTIIPFFESNLTGGQFLFYPWFIYIFILNCRNPFLTSGVNSASKGVIPSTFS